MCDDERAQQASEQQDRELYGDVGGRISPRSILEAEDALADKIAAWKREAAARYRPEPGDVGKGAP